MEKGEYKRLVEKFNAVRLSVETMWGILGIIRGTGFVQIANNLDRTEQVASIVQKKGIEVSTRCGPQVLKMGDWLVYWSDPYVGHDRYMCYSNREFIKTFRKL